MLRRGSCSNKSIKPTPGSEMPELNKHFKIEAPRQISLSSLTPNVKLA